MRIIKANDQRLGDVETIKTEATNNFATTTSGDSTKLTAAITERTTQRAAFDPTVGTSVPSQLVEANTAVTGIATTVTSLSTAQQAVRTATTPTSTT